MNTCLLQAGLIDITGINGYICPPKIEIEKS